MSGSQFLSGVSKAANYDFFEKSSSNKIHPIDDNAVDCCGLFGSSNTAQTTGRDEPEPGEECGLLDSNALIENNGPIIKPDTQICQPLCRKPSGVNAHANSNIDLFGGTGSVSSATEEGRRLSEQRRSRILQHEESPLHSKDNNEATNSSSTVFNSAGNGSSTKANKKRTYSLLSSVLGAGGGAAIHNSAKSKRSVSDNMFVSGASMK